MKKGTNMLELYLFGVGVVLGAVINNGFFSDVYDALNSSEYETICIASAGILLVLIAALAWPIVLTICIAAGLWGHFKY
ncbi:MAG TPA: hypothetical protein VGD33_03380 [Chitinophagaceae bacterium]